MENMDKKLNVCTKIGADIKYPKCPRMYLPNLSAQAQKFLISMKKGFIGRPCNIGIVHEIIASTKYGHIYTYSINFMDISYYIKELGTSNSISKIILLFSST